MIMKNSESNLKTPSLGKRIWKGRMAYLLLAPLMIGLLIFSYYPPLSGLYHSFFDWNVTGEAVFVGLDNFRELLQSIPHSFDFNASNPQNSSSS